MLDFTKGRKAQPPARLCAQARAVMKAKGLPQGWADVVAARMETVSEVEELVPMLEKVLDLFKATGVAISDTSDMLEKALEAMGNPPAGEDYEGDIPQDDQARMLRNVVAQITMKKRAENPIRIAPGIDWDSPASMRAKMQDGLAAVLDRTHVPTIGRRFAGMRISEIAMECARKAGHKPTNVAQAVRMATHSASDFPLILEGAVGNTIARRIALRAPDILRAAAKKTNADYRPSRSLTLSAMKAVQEVGEGGEIRHSTMEEKGEANPRLRDFAGAFTISNKAIVNDDLGLFEQAAQRMTDACVQVQRNVLLEPIQANSGAGQTMADGNPMFDAAHGNVAASGAALSVTSLSAARTALRKQKGKAGELLAIEPFALVVPAELETVAQQIIGALQATKTSDVNPFAGELEIIVEPGLSSATAWYLIGNPSLYDGLTWATLDGFDAPRVESRPGWDTLGFDFRVTWALDAAFTETATWYKNPGA